ncbi:hypothetical protein Thi970DRAFT_02942 [Thiorhodovibrio frisius]|uniref:Lipoprotein n=1 Tax=Thiorhodovibrio frisius TaxID=631362 RepID=H8Z2A2_9GAMM|nr:hypothetical protein [Thiorhodovibrio frisius]EIC22664.1 hypothetical protein Thi970DRAFT_02942 [Thiorhodovibrio frisius]WPL22420.1 hypothetical protein Thiofri_02584 [Thiorhodovibrio frisius]
MNSHRSCFQRLRPGFLLLTSAIFVVLTLSACGHVPRSPEAPDRSAAQPSTEADLLAASAPADRQAKGGASAWRYGQKGDTLAVFPPLSAAQGLSLGGAHRPASVYTYVLYGIGDGKSSQATRPWRHTEFELLRLIDTYVLSAGALGTEEPEKKGSVPTRHEFFVPVYDGLGTLPLSERSAPDLADAARQALAQRLDARRYAVLASQLRTAPGPFLISRTTSDLVPDQENGALLLADLSKIGPEHLYRVVDTYDRPVSASAAGTDAALSELRQRLARLESPLGGVGENQWVQLIEASAVRPADGAMNGG